MTEQTKALGQGGDPGDFTVPEVNDYLANLDLTTSEGGAELERVMSAERAGRNRTTVVDPSDPATTDPVGASQEGDAETRPEAITPADAVVNVAEQINREHAERQELAGGVKVDPVKVRHREDRELP